MRCRDARRFVCDIIRQKQCCHVLYRAGLPVGCSMYECMPIYVGLLFEVNSGGAGTCVLTHATMTHPRFFYFLHPPTSPVTYHERRSWRGLLRIIPHHPGQETQQWCLVSSTVIVSRTDEWGSLSITIVNSNIFIVLVYTYMHRVRTFTYRS